MRFKDHFSDVALGYAAARPGYPRELFEFLAGTAPARERAWDCATGNGQAAIGLSEWFADVQATDASSEQIAMALPRDRITYSEQMAERTGFADNSFDLVNVATALHWFDLEPFYDEVCRVLKPGGLFAAYGYKLFKASPDLDPLVREKIFDLLDPFWPPEIELVREGYRSLPFPFDEIEMPKLEMCLEWSFEEFTAYLGTWSSLRAHVGKYGPKPMQQAMAEVALVWGAPETRRRITMDLVGRAGHLGGAAG